MKILKKNLPNKKPDIILLDLDDTLYSYEEAHLKAMAETEKQFVSQIGDVSKNFKKKYAKARREVKVRLTNSTSSRNRLLYFQEIFEELGMGTSVENVLNLENTYWLSLLKNARLFKGVIDFLEIARINSIPISIITNLSAQIQFQKLLYFGIHDYFKFIITSEQVGVEKPHNEIFEFAMQKHESPRENVWMIGDDIIADITGAKSTLGCVTFLKSEKFLFKSIECEECDIVFNDFFKLTAYLEKICKS